MDENLYKLLKLIDKKESVSEDTLSNTIRLSKDDCAKMTDYLNSLGYIDISDDWVFADRASECNSYYSITQSGKVALFMYSKNKKINFWKEFRAWITLAIAVAAFIKSFFG